MLTGFHINPDGTATGILTEFSDNTRFDTHVEISKDGIEGFMLSSGDGVSSYKDDLTALVIAHKG